MSQMYNLCEEIKTGKPRSKPTKANARLNIALRKPTLAPAMSERSAKLCKCSFKIIENVNKRDMKARRKSLKTIKRLRGQPETDIAIQSDEMLNNIQKYDRLYSSMQHNEATRLLKM